MANEDELAQATEEAAPEAAKPKSNLAMIVIIGLVITIVTPVITFFVVKATVPPPPTQEEVPKATAKTVYNLGELYTNVAETKGTRILKLEPVLVLSESRLENALNDLQPLLKDRILMAASTKTIDELDGPNGKEALKREIIGMVNAAIKDRMSGAVIDVYFNQFLIQ